jgi:hypothetical protein
VIQSRSRSIAIAITTTVAGVLIFAGTASAFTDPPVKLGAESGNLEASAQYLLENSPRKISGIEPTAQSEALYKTVTEPPPGADALVQDELENETPSLLKTVGAWVWNKAPEVAVAAAGGWAGWEIGSAIYGTFFEESTPIAATSFPVKHWGVEAPGEALISAGGLGTAYASEWGLVSVESGIGQESTVEQCNEELYGDGSRVYPPGGWYSEPFCGEYRPYVLYKPLAPIKCEVGTCEGIETVPYEGAGQPTAPTPEALRESLKEALESGEYPGYNRLYNFEHEPENLPDPLITKDQEDHRCDRSPGPSYENTGGNMSPEPFAQKIETPFTITNLPKGYEEAPPVYLRWGEASWRPGKPKFEGIPYLDLWDGWGYRHIVAKHGWSALDLEETELALADGVPTRTEKESQFVYSTPEIAKGIGGVECIRHVVVDFEAGEDPKTKEPDPAPRGIVTSYNEVK